MMRVFLSKDNIRPGNEWFLERDRPLTLDMVKADHVALHRAIDVSYGFDDVAPEQQKTIISSWVEKVVQNHQEL